MSSFTFGIPFATTNISWTNQAIGLSGHKVVGDGYCGSLECTGLTHWKVGELTAAFIGQHSRDFFGKDVLELGCGLGLCGITAAKAVGTLGSVVLTDGDDEVVNLAARNCASNGVGGNTNCFPLRWPADMSDICATAVPHSGSFDIIIGSDIIGYGTCSTAFELLLTVVKLLKPNSETVSNMQSTHSTAGAVVSTTTCVDGATTNYASPRRDDATEAVSSGDGGGWQQLQEPDSAVRASKLPVFVLGYTRRLTRDAYDINLVLNFANSIGLDWSVAEDSYVDIFGNSTSEKTMCMEHCVFLFTRKRET